MNEGGLWKRGVSVCGSSMMGNLQGGLLYWGPRKICQVRLWKWASVSIGVPFWGKWGEVPFLGPPRGGWDICFY